MLCLNNEIFTWYQFPRIVHYKNVPSDNLIISKDGQKVYFVELKESNNKHGNFQRGSFDNEHQLVMNSTLRNNNIYHIYVFGNYTNSEEGFYYMIPDIKKLNIKHKSFISTDELLSASTFSTTSLYHLLQELIKYPIGDKYENH